MILLNIKLTFDNALVALIFLAASFLLFFIGKLVYQLFHRDIKVNHELVEKDNLAFSVALVGYFIGLVLAIGSAIIGESDNLLDGMIDVFSYGLLAILLMNISIIINDKLILRKFNVKKEIIEDMNVGTGVVEAASSIGTGLIIMGTFLGGDDGTYHEAVMMWAMAQVIMVITAFVYNLITPYDVHEHIEKDNAAVGIAFAGALIAMANIIRFAIEYDYESWIEAAQNIGLDVAIGLLFLPIARFVTDKILLPGRSITDELINQEKPNHGVALIEAFAYIGGSVLITWCL